MKTVQERLTEYGKQFTVTPNETKLKTALLRSREAFLEEAAKQPVSYAEFFCWQAGYIQKRWWVLQLLVLTVLWWCIRSLSGTKELPSVMGIMAAVFVILLIPELWKSKVSGAMEVEGSTYYSLRQIYAVRMLAFGLVDVGLLSTFTVVTSVTTPLQGKEIIIHFFLPFTVACGILFRTLCSRYIGSQTGAVFLSLLWIAIWIFVVMNESIYQRISVLIWAVLLAAAALYLCYVIKKALTMCESFWEVTWNGITD